MKYLKSANNNLPIYIGILLLFIFLSIFYSRAIFKPNQYLFCSDGDGLKNYFTYAYQIKNDSSFIHTNAVNYPFGENFVYLDSQPLFTTLLKLTSKIFPSISNFSIGFMNLLIIISTIIAFVLIYLIFIEYAVNRWLSAFAALFIITLSPQFYRFYGHYSLSYMWVIPGILYSTLIFFKTQSIKNYLIIFLFIFLTFFIHSYLGFIAFSLFITVSLLQIIFHWKSINKIYILKVISIGIVPVLLYYIIASATDSHIERTKSPVGLFTYHSDLKSIFLPTEFSHTIFYRWIIDVPEKNMYEFEGIAYVGFFVNISIIVISLLTLYFLFRKKINVLVNIFKKDIVTILLVSIIFLIIALEKPIESIIIWLVDYISPLKQFRALGRLSWVFYYLISIFVVTLLYRWFEFLKSKNKLAFLLLLPFVFIPIESYLFHNNFSKYFFNNKNIFLEKNLEDDIKIVLNRIKTENYQAILPLPFFHFGSDDFLIEPNNQKTRLYSMIFAYHTNKGMLACNTGRTSVKETRQVLQILLPEFYDKSYKNQLKKEPFLVIHAKNEKLNEREQEILNLSENIIETENILVKKISYENLFKYSVEKPLISYLNVNDSVFLKNGFFVTDTTASIFYNNFDDLASPITHYGKSSFQGNKKIYNHLAEFKPGILKENETYCVSFWYYNKGNSRTHNIFVIEEIDENQQTSWIVLTDPRFSYIVNNYWSLVELEFTVKNNLCTYKIFSIPIKTWQDTFYVDDLLIRPKNVSVFKVLDNKHKGILFYNNHFIETPVHFAILDSRKETITKYYIHQIESNLEWYEKIKKEASLKNISLKDYIRKNAEYMTTETYLKPLDIEEIKIQYYVNRIKNDKYWFEHIINKPENKGKDIEQILIENAKFVLNN